MYIINFYQQNQEHNYELPKERPSPHHSVERCFNLQLCPTNSIKGISEIIINNATAEGVLHFALKFLYGK